MGREVVVAITDARLDFGPWEQIFYGEFDGCRRKRVLVKIIGDSREQGRLELLYVHHPQFRGQGCPRPQ